MNPGRFRHRITLQQLVEVKNDEVNETTLVPQDMATLWASVEPVKGREYYEAQTLRKEMTYNIYIPYSPSLSLNPSMLIKFNNRVFQIIDIINMEERNKYWHIHATEKVRT